MMKRSSVFILPFFVLVVGCWQGVIYSREELLGTYHANSGWDFDELYDVEISLYGDSTYNEIHTQHSLLERASCYGVWELEGESISLVPQGFMKNFDGTWFRLGTMNPPSDTFGPGIRTLQIDTKYFLLLEDETLSESIIRLEKSR
jgi:hypothetical protein